MWSKVAEGSGTAGLRNLSRYEGEMVEGARGKITLNLRTSLSPDVARNVEYALRQAGVKGATIVSSGNKAEVYFNKGFGWLAIIATIIIGSLILAILIVSWQFWQEVAQTVSPLVLNIAIIVGAILLIFIMWKTKGLQVGG